MIRGRLMGTYSIKLMICHVDGILRTYQCHVPLQAYEQHPGILVQLNVALDWRKQQPESALEVQMLMRGWLMRG